MNLFISDNRILNGAESLFVRYGIKNVTMDDLAHHLGISKKTIYKDFSDKNSIVVQLVESSLNEHFNQMEEIATVSNDAVEEIIRTMRYTTGIFSSVNPNVFYDMQRYHPEAWDAFSKFKNEHILKQIIRNLEKGRKESLYRSDFNIGIIARLRLGEVDMSMNPGQYPPDKYKLSEVNMQILEHYLYGICTLKGHKLISKYKKLFKDVSIAE